MYKLLSLLFLFVPTLCFAGMVGDYALVKNEVWSKVEGYTINGSVTVQQGVTLRVSSSDLNLNQGSIYVYGTLEITGATVSSNNTFQGVFVIGGSLLISDTTYTGCPRIQVWNKGSFVASRSTFSACESSGSIITGWNNSNISISDSVFKENKASTIVDAYDRASVVIDGSEFKNNQTGRILQIYGVGSLAQVQNSQFTDSSNTNGIEIFNNATSFIEKSTFSNIKSGIQAFGGAEVVVSENNFLNNNMGVEMYNASTTISGNSFEQHSEYAVFASGGSIDARNNWWADATGPKNLTVNLTGKGEQLDGFANVYPWLVERPNIEKCCSTVMFFPGIQGSRLYTRGYFFENQLWEPNRDKDVQKLFFNEKGESVSKAIYTRDIIETTNIGSSIGMAHLDTGVYKGFADFMNSLKKKGLIKNWEAVPYDWRYSTGEVLESHKLIWKKKFSELAKLSKTKKVILVGHSFGGILATRFAEYIEQQGMGENIDSVVIVGTPEQGSFSVAQALLHGDGQSIGGGYLLSQKTARSLTKNISSTYELLERSMSSGWFKNTIRLKPESEQKIFNSLSGVSTSAEFKDFIFKKNAFAGRLAPDSENDTSVPVIANEFVYERVKGGNHFNVSNGVVSKIYNILGTNMATPIGIEYKSICSGDYGIFFSFKGKMSPNVPCVVERNTSHTNDGDGVVPVGTKSDRYGKKIFIDFGKYMNLHIDRISHSNLLSAVPTLSLLKEIIFKRNLSLASASYITLPDSEVFSDAVPKYWKVRILGKGKVYIETDNGVIEDTVVKEGYSEKSTIPGSSYEVVEGNRYILLPVPPKKIEVVSSDFGYSNVTVETVALENSVYTTSLQQPVYFYPTIPVTPKTTITANYQTPSLVIDFNGDSAADENLLPDIATTTQGYFQRKYKIDEIINELHKLKTTIQQGPTRQKFKDRYVLKIDSLLRRIRVYDVRNPIQYSSTIHNSLQSIIEEVQTGYKNYKGGINLEEASLLHVGFGKIYLMFLNLE